MAPRADQEPQPVPRRVLRDVAVWLVPALVAFGVGWWGMLAVGISRDETATIDISTRSVPDIWRMVQHADTVHAAYYLILHFWTGAFGISPMSLRLPSLIGTAIAAALVGVLGRMLVSPRAGFAAGLLFACSPEISAYAHNARSYGMDSALVVLLVILFVRAMRSNRPRAWAGYGLMLVLTVVMHLFTLLIVPAQGITMLLYARSQRSWRPLLYWLAAAVPAVAVLSPFLLRAISQGGTASWIPPLHWHDVGLFVVNLGGGKYVFVAMLLIAAFGAFEARKVTRIALPWLLLPPVLLFGYSIRDPLYVFRYLLYCLPALLLLVAAGMERLKTWLHLTLLAVLIAATIPLHISLRDPNIGANDFRAEATFIAANKQPGDAIMFLVPTQRQLASSDRPAYSGLHDIAEGKTPAEAANFSGADVSDTVLAQRLRSVDRVWAVVYWVARASRPAAHASENKRYKMLKAAGLRWVETVHFRGGAFQLYQRKS
ncbi:MAG TPA: glycosyltransferase family 39 protein [Micromonosporaceae bacterium]